MAAASDSSKSKKKTHKKKGTLKIVSKWPRRAKPANSHFTSSLDHVGGEPLFMFESVTSDDLLDGDVSSREEPHQPNQADDDVLDDHQRRHVLSVKR